jgi:hypothetical protein
MFLLLPTTDSVDLRRPVRLPRLEPRANYIKLEEARKPVGIGNHHEGGRMAKKLDLSNSHSADCDPTFNSPHHRRNQEAGIRSVDWLIGENSNHVARKRERREDGKKPGSRLTPCDGRSSQGPRRARRSRPDGRISRLKPQSQPAHAAICDSKQEPPSDLMKGHLGSRSVNGLGQEPLGRVERSASVKADDIIFYASMIQTLCAPADEATEFTNQVLSAEGAMRVPLSECMYEKYFSHGISFTTGNGPIVVWTHKSHHDERPSDTCVGDSDDLSSVDEFASGSL